MAVHRGLNVYRQILKLYPTSYQKSYGAQMILTAEDMLDGTNNVVKRFLLYAKLFVELPFSLLHQQLEAGAGQLLTTPPTYIYRTSYFSTALLLPFFAALGANWINQLFYGKHLVGSWLWSRGTAIVWAIRLPELALLTVLASYLIYVWRTRDSKGRLFRLRSYWPLLIPGLLAVGILILIIFHDSLSCPLDSSLGSHYLTQTWHCIQSRSAFTKSLLF